MKSNRAFNIIQTSFYHFYREVYAPVLMDIDILLKSMESPITATEAAQTLHMTPAAVKKLMRREQFEIIDKNGFLTLMRLGESAICRLYQREVLRGLKLVYTPADIAYIYGLDESHVESVSAELGHDKWPAMHVPELLEKIPVLIFY